MRQLWHTGWMHNRVRMIVGSFLVKHLRQHWVEGARWFWDTLCDADLPNNTCGWHMECNLVLHVVSPRKLSNLKTSSHTRWTLRPHVQGPTRLETPQLQRISQNKVLARCERL
jgi:hypothetical protein